MMKHGSLTLRPKDLRRSFNLAVLADGGLDSASVERWALMTIFPKERNSPAGRGKSIAPCPPILGSTMFADQNVGDKVERRVAVSEALRLVTTRVPE